MIAVDIDEVLMALHDPFFSYYNRQFGTNFPLADTAAGPLGYYVDTYVPSDEHKQVTDRIRAFLDLPEFQDIEPLQGAVHGLSVLSQNFTLILITARQRFYKPYTLHWLARHFPDGIVQHIEYVDHLEGHGPKVAKSTICRRMGVDYVIDDGLPTAIDCAEQGIKVVLFGDYPWNQAEELPTGVTRCVDWAAVLDYFDAA